MARNFEDLDRIIQSCLEAIERDGESIQSVIARYPHLEASLRPSLEAYIWLRRIKSKLDPQPEFISSSRERLVAQIQRVQPAQATARGLSLRDILSGLGARKLALQLTFAVLFIILLLAGTGSAVLASRTAVPGDNLYPVKIAQERVRLALSFTRVGDARLHALFAQERLVEIQRLVLEERFEFLDETVSRYEREVAQAIELTRDQAEQDDSEAVALVAQVEGILTNQKLVLSALSQRVPEGGAQHIARALDLAGEALVAVDAIKDRLAGIESPTSTATPTRTATVFKTRAPVPSPSSTDLLNSRLDLTPTGTYEPVIEQTFATSATTAPTQVSNPVKPPTPTPTETPKPTKEKIKPKPTNTHRPTARPTNTHRPDGDKDD